MKTIIAHLTIALFLAACGQQSSDPAIEKNDAAEPGMSIYAAAVDSPSRPDADRERDTFRQPAAVLEFFGIEPGMTVLDLFSGGGYYAELLSSIVGESGLVVAHSNQAYLGVVGDEFQTRHAENRLPNVEVMMAENNELELDAGHFDAIMMTLSFHDLYYSAPDRGWPKIDGEKLLAELYKGTRPGGLVGVIDHHADAGSPSETGNTLHRIDPAIVIAQFEAAGFVLEDESELLRNMNDDHSKIVFDPEIRGKSDRFVMRFRKPE